MSASNNKVIEFFKSMKSEFKRITWPTKDNAKKSIVSVFVFIVACAVLTGVLDSAFGALAGYVLKTK